MLYSIISKAYHVDFRADSPFWGYLISMTNIDIYSLTTVPIEQCANGLPFGIATGFVWLKGPQPYLITNWHVVTGQHARTGNLETPVQPDMLRVQFNTRQQEFGKKHFDITIRGADNEPLWYVHPVSRRRADIAAVPLCISPDDPIVNLYPMNMIETDLDLAIHIGMDVFILGYPFTVGPPGFPVWKRGSIASEPDLAALDQGYLLVDTASRPGMSGAPVIRRSWGAHLMRNGSVLDNMAYETKFIGVYSGRLHTKDQSDAQLGMVWLPRYIEDIVTVCQLDA
jgi:hypothetical protein